jgi:diguanylate cyclase (GGDEF)-like protein
MSAIDGMTGISNHRVLIEFLKAGISEADRTKAPLSVALFDIDNFKSVNDSKGYVYGDQVLTDVAALIKNSVRENDLAGRYGGEEFMVVFTNTGIDSAAKIAERIRQAVEKYPFEDGLKITLSGGVKQYEGESFMELVHLADVKLYDAKKQGKNRIVY